MNQNYFEIQEHKLLKYSGQETEVSIPEDVTCIASGAFEHCESMEHLIVPESVKQIEAEAFHYCTGLKDITIYSRKMPFLKYHMPFLRFFCESDCVLEHGADNFLRICINGEIMPYRELGYYRHEYIFDLLEPLPDSEKFRNMLQEYADVFLYCLLNDDLRKSDVTRYRKETKEEIFQKMLAANMFTEANIDTCISVTVEMKDVTIRPLLIDFKYQHCNFQNPADQLKL
ncbi:MAG: leucine-rich repeat protein [Oscillospiraceae bacterium]|nr:leucine-rich repeat protein [Oscillospiraceae bacterium]